VVIELIRQGDVFWIELGEPYGSEPGFRRPYVIVQSDLFNATNLQTVVVCALTTNLRRAEAPGNVLLHDGEAGLPRRSVVNVTQVFTVDRDRLMDKIGTLSRARIDEIYQGLQILLKPL
jgi:mRNA interferase MazF